MAVPTAKDKAWAIFDRIVEDAKVDGEYDNPWRSTPTGVTYEADIETLQRLLAVPLHLRATVRSGVPALALDVWLAFELRRAGFEPDAVWPRAEHPRILPRPVAALLRSLPKKQQAELRERLTRESSIKQVTASSASILGKNYLKQVDVIMTDWATGPEVLISTKRMDSSYGKNAPNRIEESYGDAKNLRLRHPLAALGFLMAVRSDIRNERDELTFRWLNDLMQKLGREEDAYHATCFLLMEYPADVSVSDEDHEEPDGIVQDAGPGADVDAEEEHVALSDREVEAALQSLPSVTVQTDAVDRRILPDAFLQTLIERVLDITPVTMHDKARRRRTTALDQASGAGV